MMEHQPFPAELYRYYGHPQYNNAALQAVSYQQLSFPQRPAELPLAELQHHHHHHHHQNINDQARLAYRPTYASHQSQKMAYPKTDDELADFQKLSNEYQPEITVCHRSLSCAEP